MAPAAKWIAAKIFNDRGVATTAGIHQAFQWLLDPDNNPNTADAPNVVNDSWVMSAMGCNTEFQLDLQRLRAAGILPVFAAGNSGPDPSTSYSPGNNPEAFAVGATNNADALDPSSSRGPSACDGSPYPALMAPGDDITTSDLYGGYATESGTSLAAPHVAGALALLLSAFPNTSADRQAAALKNSALDLGPAGPDNDFGWGRLDALNAYNWLASAPDYTITASPSPASTDPGGTVSYTVNVAAVNGFSGDIGLSLSGLSSSQASWSFQPATVNAAGGTSTLTVTTASSLAPGTYGLTITGTSGTLTHTVPVNLIVTPPPDFTVAASPTSASVNPGGIASYTVTVGSVSGFTGNVSLSLTGLSASQGSWTFSPTTVTGGSGTSSLAVTTSRSLSAGTYHLTVTGTSGTISHVVSLTLVVGSDFALAVSPSSISVTRGTNALYTVSNQPLGAFTGSVALSISGLPGGSSATFSPNPLQAGGSAVLTVRTSKTTARGTFTLKVTGKSGSVTHQVTTKLIVS
jgi:subtilisin family serine protease